MLGNCSGDWRLELRPAELMRRVRDWQTGLQVTELYTGNRGLLFWMGKVTYALIFVLIGGWIVFRFVLPGLGILELQNGLDSPPNL